MALTDGHLVEPRFPYLQVHLQIGQREASVEALLDTGFDGDVIVPLELVAGGPPPNGYLPWTLADGSSIFAPWYVGTIQVGDLPPLVGAVTALGDEPLVGVGVAARFRIILDHGRRVIVEP